jgi:hypothetical protein
MAEAGNTKVEQIGNIATNYGTLQPVLPSQVSPLTPIACGPDFTVYKYFKGCRNLKHHTCFSYPISFWIKTPNVNLVSDKNVTKVGGSNSAFDEGIFTTAAYNNFTLTFKVGSITEAIVALAPDQKLFEDSVTTRTAQYALLIHETQSGFVEGYSAVGNNSTGGINYTLDSVLKITATSTLITMYIDNNVIRSIGRINNNPLHVNISFYRIGGSITDITITPN